MARLRQLRLLLWKNYVLQFRRPIGTIVELLLPIVAIVVLVLVRLVFDNAGDSGEQCFSTFDEQSLTGQFDNDDDLKPPFVIAYAPNTSRTVEWIMKRSANTLSRPHINKSVTARGFETESLAVAEAEQDEVDEKYNYIGVAYFENLDEGTLQDSVRYKLRLPHGRTDQNSWRTDRVFPLFEDPGPREPLPYFNGFVQSQFVIEEAITAWKVQELNGGSSTNPIPTTIRQYPFPSYINDTFSQIARLFLPLLLLLAFIYTAGQVVKELVYEKQERLKETMKMMGLANWIHWIGWFIKELSFLLIPVIVITIIAVAGKVFRKSDGFIIFLFFLVFVVSGISFMFMLSTFFSSARLGMICGYLFWFLTFFPYLIISGDSIYVTMDRNTKSLACLLSTMCMGLGSRQIFVWEGRGVGATFDNIAEGPTVDDDFSVGITLGMMLLDTVIYLVIAWYKEAVFPGEYGIPQPWYFFVTSSYWLGTTTDNAVDVDNADGNISMKELESSPSREADPTDLSVGISIRNLTKVYMGHGGAGHKLAVDGISLNLFNGQVTSLLGHNGAGKTTTMSVITGLFPPTSGDVIVNGHSVVKDIDRVRESLGLCPQHNVLFDRLTVKEHLEFFIQLKGIKKGPEMNKEVQDMIEDLNLVDKTNQPSSALSGGMKRKLSVGVALVGGSEVVVLDEPTAGMDPAARRATWDLLLKHKPGRTVLLTTHYMDEADLLGDRIAIMSEGQIRCVGSSHFLKERYGVGYHLTVVKGEQCQPRHVTQYIKERIPSAKLHSDVGHELSYILPRDETGKFNEFFQHFEEEGGAIGVESFGMSLTTMEEVFLRVEQSVDESAAEKLKRRESILGARQSSQSLKARGKPSGSSYDEAVKEGYEEHLADRNSGITLWTQQFVAMYIKRFINSKRDLYAVIWQLILPVIFTALALVNVLLIDFGGNDPPRVMTLADLGPRTKAYIADFPQKANARALKFATDYLQTVGVEGILDIRNASLGIQNESARNASSMKACCNSRFLVLKDDCIDWIRDQGGNFISNAGCGDDFGYRLCDGCPSSNGGENCLYCTDDAIRNTPLSNPGHKECPLLPSPEQKIYDETYFMEYVLRQSNDQTFFDHHACGYTLVDILPTDVDKFRQYYERKQIDIPDNASVVATVWFSNQAFHTTAAAVNAYSNFAMRFSLSEALGGPSITTADLDYVNRQEITVINHPLPKTTQTQSEDALTDPSGLVLAFFVSLGVGFLACSFILFPIQERESNAKHLQFLSGVNPFCYWLGSLCWDFTNYMIPALIILILFAAFQIDAYSDNLGAVFVILVLYGLSVLPLVYLLAFLFKSPYTGFAASVLVIVLSSWLGFIFVYVLAIPSIGEADLADVLAYIFFLQPNFAVSQCLADMNTNAKLKEVCTVDIMSQKQCQMNGQKFVDNVFDFERPGIGLGCLYMGLETLGFFLLLILAEYRFFVDKAAACLFPNRSMGGGYQGVNEDSDVVDERMHVLSDEFDPGEFIVAVKNLTKKYSSSPTNAVDHMSFSIPRGECFGLLGLNGAGKTTTFRMLTGDLSMTAGTAFVDGLSIRENLHAVQRRIGYCPQFDALIDRLTGRELLTMYARLRGYKEKKIEQLVNSTIERLDLGRYGDKLCGTYSGGNKRKLSTAIALVGDPVVIFLDEPTAGMDPKARRFLWDYLVGILREGRSIVLTSHSMEECEALCTRLGIMVNGQFKCLGSIQHLKNKFGSGYALTVVVGDEPDSSYPQTAPVQSFIDQTFPGARLVEHHGGQLEYEISGETISWSAIFGHLESAQVRLNLAGYSVSQTTLEQVFLHFAKAQREEESLAI